MFSSNKCTDFMHSGFSFRTVRSYMNTIHTRISFTCEVFLISHIIFSKYYIDMFNNYLFLARLLKDMILYFFSEYNW
jgi:accessory gene regulator protein AgrB